MRNWRKAPSMLTEQVGKQVRLQTCIREVLGSKLGWGTCNSDWDISCLSSAPPENGVVVSRLGQERFIFNSFQIHQFSHHPTVYSIHSLIRLKVIRIEKWKCCSQLSTYFKRHEAFIRRQLSHLSVQTKLDSFFKPALSRSKASVTSEASINK
jgi:hypothetical protein